MDFSGWFRITASTANTFEVLMKHNRSAGAGDVDDIDSWVASSSTSFTSPLRVPVFIGEDGNYGHRGFDSLLIESQVATKLSIAINAVMSTD